MSIFIPIMDVCGFGCLVTAMLLEWLQNHNPKDEGNANFRSFKKFHIQSLENKVCIYQFKSC